jgi:hypothetical protein
LWSLRLVSGFAHRPVLAGSTLPPVPDTRVQAALRELQARHHEDPLPAVEAFAEAVAVLDAHAALDAFTAWRRNRMDVCLCEWPVDDTSDPESVRSLRAV